MSKRTYGHTSSGQDIDDDLVDVLAKEAAEGYDVEAIIARRGRRGRPPIGSARSTVESVRLDPELKAQLVERAQHDGVAVSEVIRRALREHLAAS